ncbi:MAG: ABC transporter permease, partial [Bacillota bacterium]
MSTEQRGQQNGGAGAGPRPGAGPGAGPGFGPGRGPGRGGPLGGGPHAGMMMPGEKAKDTRGTLRRLVVYLQPRRAQLSVIIGMAVLSTIFSIVGPKILGKATTKLFEGIVAKMMRVPGAHVDYTYIGRIILLLAGLYLLSALFSYIQQYIMAGVAQNTVYDMRRDVEAKLARLPLKYFDSRTHGEILSRVTNDIDMVSSTLQQSVTQLITSAVTIVGVLIMMLTISPLLTLIAVVTLPLSFVATMAIAKRSQRYFGAQQKTIGELNGHVEEMYTGHGIVKAFGREKRSVAEFGAINDRLYDAAWRAQFVSGILFPLMTFINNIGYVFVSVVGGIMVTKRTIEIGDVQAF